MRKNFTQLFMGLALMVGFSTMSSAQCDIDPPPGAIYNFQFDGGLEGWTTFDAIGEPTTIGWAWSETGDISLGAYGPADGTVIGSESQCNGAVVFDSDFLDNQGIQGNFGMGDCPAPCNGYLVSPVLDLSGATEPLELMFFQASRQFTSEYYLYISLDGGNTNADTVRLNELYSLNGAHNMELMRVPFCDAPIHGESNVVLTFHYDANYYYWAMDDISILPSAAVDMRVNQNFYAKMPHYSTPKNMIRDEVPMLADIENYTVYDSPASTLTYRVRDAADEVIYTSTRDYESVPGCTVDENKLFDERYSMPNDEAFYSLEYEISAEGDDFPRNNLVSAPFKISDREFRTLPTETEFDPDDANGYLSGVRPIGSFISWGAYFYIPKNDGQQAIESVSLGIITNPGDIPSPGTINVAAYQWIDISEDGNADIGETFLLGEVDYFLTPGTATGKTFFTVTPLDENGELIVPEEGAEILIMAHPNPFDGNINYFFTAARSSDPDLNQFSTIATRLAHIDAGVIGGHSSFAANDGASHDDRHERRFYNSDGQDPDGVEYVYDVSLMLTEGIDVGTEDINENLGINVFPSLASTTVNVDLNLEEISDKVSVEIMDLAGNKAGTYNFSNIKKDRLSIDVSELPNGMYLMNVRTEAGMTSKKISVIH